MTLEAFLSNPAQWVLALSAIAICRLLFRKRSVTLPPGPKGIPIVGNLLDLPPSGVAEYIHWKKFAKYGPISCITSLGTTIIIINDTDLALDILEKQAAKSSGRPSTVFGSKLCGYDKFFVTRDLDADTKGQRKMIQQAIGSPKLASKFQDVQQTEAIRLLMRTLQRPQQLMQHIRTVGAAAILAVVFGYTVEPHGPDPLVNLVNNLMEHITKAFAPGMWLVDLVPILQHLPTWFPGSGFLKTAREWSDEFATTVQLPLDFVLDQMRQNIHADSFASRTIESMSHLSDEEKEHEQSQLAGSALAFYGGGSDTVSVVLSCFVLAMAQNPEIQAKAQEEIDRVVGGDRLPAAEDRKMLPYVDALLSETLRWWPVTPIAIPHIATEDICVGESEYKIPKGALIIPPVYWMTHDPKLYQNPDKFDPERYLAPRNEPDPRFCVFGFGRRACPGRYLAENSIFLSAVHLLSAFNISKAVHQGRVVEPVANPLPGNICRPSEFEFQIKPRSEKHAEMVRDLERIHPWKEGQSSMLDYEKYGLARPKSA